ncbi:TetR/AcrR family transcriptional regulator [Nocardia terpenica]|uniref:TetR/AcrR family transcriptional regulator n=1 Tax=Nocardia terpenica TaxID=455432 RepID=UPI002FE057FC
MSEQPARGRGRPRDPAVERAILRATLDRLAADGYSRMSVADIARAAGVTKPTVYRRWPSKRELVSAALDFSLATDAPGGAGPDPAAPAGIDGLRTALRRLDPTASSSRPLRLLGSILAEEAHNPELVAVVRERAIGPRLARFADALRALQHRGDIRPDLDIDAVCTLCYGSYLADYLRSGAVSPDLPDRIATTLWPSLTV